VAYQLHLNVIAKFEFSARILLNTQYM